MIHQRHTVLLMFVLGCNPAEQPSSASLGSAVRGSGAWPLTTTHVTRRPPIHDFIAQDDETSLGLDDGPVAAVGMLLYGASPEQADEHCTVTLIGCDVALTARHCIHEDQDGPVIENAKLWVFWPNGGLFGVRAKVEGPPADEGADVAALYVDHPVDLLPATLMLDNVPDGNGRIAGFGRGKLGLPPGLRRVAEVAFEHCSDTELCWTYHSGSWMGASCAGDSGGPLFDHSGRMIGVHHGGRTYVCGTNDHPIDINLAKYKKLVSGWRIGHESCAAGGAETWGESGNDGEPWTLVVDHDTRLVRIGTDVEFRPDAAVRVSVTSPENTPACDPPRARAPSWTYCEMTNPSSGDYKLTVLRTLPTDRFQLSFLAR